MMRSVSNPCASEKARKFLFALSLVVASVTPASAKPSNVTEAEMQMLPVYCKDTMWFPRPFAVKKDYWIGRMGSTFIHMHHYCWGLVNLARAQKSDVRLGRRAAGLTDILNDFNYVINAAPPDFILLPEIYTRVGQVELLLGRPNDARDAFNRARVLKPDYWPAYSHWIEYLLKIGKKTEARALVEEGLSNSPDSKVLLEQSQLLGNTQSGVTRQTKKTAD